MCNRTRTGRAGRPRYTLALAVALVSAALHGWDVSAQEPTPSAVPPASPTTAPALEAAIAPAPAGVDLAGLIKDDLLRTFLAGKIEQLLSNESDDFRLKLIEPDASDANGGWGVDYAWSARKSRNASTAPQAGEPFILSRMDFELAVDGHYAFDDTANNQDLSTITAALALERGDFGKLPSIQEAMGIALQECLLALPQVPADPAKRAEWDRQFIRCEVESGAQTLIDRTPGASYYRVDVHGGIEANQDYSDRRTLFGLTGAYAYQPGGNSTSNFFDTPFRLLREALSGPQPYRAPYPSLLLGVERLDAKNDDTRTAVTPKTTFTRGKAEIAFNTILANIDSKVVRFNLSWRYFHELSAPDEIERAGQDKFDFVTASLRFPALLLPLIESNDFEFFLSYTSGQLPFNPSSDKAFEVGFATNVKALADFLAR